LDSSAYPDEFPHQTRVIYRPEPREVVVEWELPPQSFIPVERGYKYVATRDAIGLIPSGSAISLVVQANSFLRRPVIVRSGSSTAIYDFEPA